MSANGMREGAYDPLEDAVLAAMVASGMPAGEETREQAIAWALEGEPVPSVLAWGDVPDDAPTSPCLGPLDDLEGNGRGPT